MPPSKSESSMAHGDVSWGSRALKRVVDVGASGVGLLLASPLLLIACSLIWLEDRHSPFYVAARIGRRGRPFRMVKLRSMVVRADRTGVDSTAQGDPRITRVGHVLRRFKLDECPQLWNVLRGDMSMVGPGPALQPGHPSVEESTGPALHCSSRTPARYSTDGCHIVGRAVAAAGSRLGGGNAGRDRGRSCVGGRGPPGGAARGGRTSRCDRRGPVSDRGGGGSSVVERDRPASEPLPSRRLTPDELPQLAQQIRV